MTLVVNVSASAVTPRVRVVIAEALAHRHALEVVQTAARGHATELAAEAAEDGRDVVVVLGGDGTLNEVANGLAGTTTALAVLPGGSTNVFARTIGAKPDPVEATEQLLATLVAVEEGRPEARRRVGLGSVNGRYFVLHLGIGFDAAVIDRVERRGAVLKRYAGHPLFVLAGFDTYARHYDRKRTWFRITAGSGGGGEEVGAGPFAVILNSDPYTYLGRRPLHLAPGADLDRGLSIVAFRSLEVRTVLGVTARALGSGRRVARHPRVTTRSGVGSAVVEAVVGPMDASVPGVGARAIPYQVDGEYLGRADRLLVAHHPAVIDLVWPLAPAPPARRVVGRLRRRPRGR